MTDDPTLPDIGAPNMPLGALAISDDGQVTLRGEPVDLTARELALLRALAAEPASVVTKERLLHDVVALREATTRRLDCTAVRPRKKLRRTDADRWIGNVWGVGYTLHDGPLPAA